MAAREPAALARLRQHEPVFGLMQSLPSPTITEIAVLSGFDFVILDCEHAVVDEPSQLASLQTLAGHEAFSLVRLRPGDFSAVGRYLDFGMNGILMPDIQSPEAARDFVKAATWGPNGARSSTGASRAKHYGIISAEPANPLLIAMIEGRAGVQAVDRILDIEGIDGAVIGPHDLAADLGCPQDFGTPEYVAAFAAVEAAARHRQKILGTRPHPGFPMARLIQGGHRLILTGSDVQALRDGFAAHLRAARGAP